MKKTLHNLILAGFLAANASAFTVDSQGNFSAVIKITLLPANPCKHLQKMQKHQAPGELFQTLNLRIIPT